MNNLEMPTMIYAEVLDSCVGTMMVGEVKASIVDARNELLDKATRYEAHGYAKSLYLMPKGNDLASLPQNSDLKNLYAGQLRRRGVAARTYYDCLISSAPHKRCPICGIGTVSTLDHYLPSSVYGYLSVLPMNLVPACRDCNTNKLDQVPASAAEQSLHVYFDNVSGERWLFARVVPGDPPAVEYFVQAPSSFGPVLSERLGIHMTCYSLYQLFASNAGSELAELEARLTICARTGGSGAVQRYLREEAGLQEGLKRNSWKTALYDSLACSEWFCSRFSC